MLLFPILGASLIILSTPNSWISKRILANKVMVTLGLISYPLYLWHWPIFSLDKIIFNSTASLSRQSILILISLILAYLTYSLIEKPLRKSGEGKIKYFILIFLMIFLGFFGWRCFERSGYPHRSGAFIVNKIGDTGYDAFSDHLEKSYKNCIPSELNNWVARYKNKPRCFQSQVGTHRDIVLLGDSHAEHLFPGLASEFSDKNVIYLMNSDLPFFTVDHYAKIFQWIANDENISTVIFSMYWAKRLPGLKLDDFELKFDQTISFLKKSGKRVIILDDVPDFSFDAKECKYKRLNGRVKCSEKRHFLEEVDEYYPYLNEVSQRTGVTVVNLSHLFCSGDECNMTAGNALLYRDVNHLNLQGSLFVGRALKTEHAIP
jgi:hypothetical protein